MSVNLQYPQAITDLQIYNNAVFDNHATCPVILSHDSSKENQSPVGPLNPNPDGSPRIKLMEEAVRDEKRIDIEIEGIEKEIIRLSERLKVLKLEKQQKNVKIIERRVRIVPAKFMEHKQNVRSSNLTRGLSLGPWEIGGVDKFRTMHKPELTPVESIKNRRKSCFFKLGEIDEMRVIKERGKSCSLSPKSTKALNKTQGTRQVLTTVGTRKGVKKDEGLLAAIQPKNLFKDGDKSLTAKKPIKSGRVIASRYNQTTILSAMRKRSLQENDKDEGKKCDTKRSLSVGKSHQSMPQISSIQGTKSCIKKRWEIPSETVVFGDIVLPDVLPKITTARHTIDTPRDSGAAKRVAELIGNKSFFSSTVCQQLSFVQEE